MLWCGCSQVRVPWRVARPEALHDEAHSGVDYVGVALGVCCPHCQVIVYSDSPHQRHLLQRHQRQYLYFCTSKASELGTLTPPLPVFEVTETVCTVGGTPLRSLPTCHTRTSP